MGQIKVFHMDDIDWWAGRTLESTKRAYLAETGLSADEAFEEFEPYELPDTELDRLKFIDEDRRNAEGKMVKFTFREHLLIMITEGEKFPCFFASSEW